MNPGLKTSNSLSIIHWGVYLKGLAESCRIIIRKTYLCCFPTIIFRNTTNLKTFICQTWDWAKSQHIRAGKKELKCSSRKQKAPELQQYWGITAFTLSGWKQPQALSYYSQASVGQPAPEWTLSLASTAEDEISATSMQEQTTPSLKVSASYTPQRSQSHFPSPSAALSSTRGTKQPKALTSSAKHKVTVLLQLYQLKKFKSEATRIPFISPNIPSPEKQPNTKRNHHSSKSPTTDGFK